MMQDEVISEFKQNVEKALGVLRAELGKVRTGRANLAILDGVRVEYYGTPTPLHQVATLAVADARLITIKPWEKSMVAEIEKAIKKSQLGLNPNSDGEILRVPIPLLTEERRKELTKIIKRHGEETKVAIRSARRDAKEMIEELCQDGDISEDTRDRALKDLQTQTDAGVARVDEVLAKKEKELMEV
jgi:ribosome recycling factor